MTVYEACTEKYGEETLDILQCLSNWIEEQNSTTSAATRMNTTTTNTVIDDYDVFRADMVDWLLILTGALVFFMQAGFAMVCAGAIRKKNVNNTVCFHIYIFRPDYFPNMCDPGRMVVKGKCCLFLFVCFVLYM
jgi:hypothetical protein